MSEPILSIRDLTVAYGAFVAVREVSMDLHATEVLALIGPNGAGKTTLLNAASGLLPPAGGSIATGDRDLLKLPAYARAAAGIRRTFQHARLVDELTVVENVLVGAPLAFYPRSLLAEWLGLPGETGRLNARRDRARELLAGFGIGDHADELTSRLSFGQKKMVDLARAMMSEPRILMMDEPTAGLNEEEIERLAAVIAGIRRTTSILVVAHHMGFVNKVADKVVCLVAGSVISRGTPREVQSDPSVLASYMGTV